MKWSRFAPSLKKLGCLSRQFAGRTNRRIEFQKGSQQFLPVRNETLSIAMCVSNPDRLPLGIHG